MEVSVPRFWEGMAKEQQQQQHHHHHHHHQPQQEQQPHSKENDGLATRSKTRFLIDELISSKSPPKSRNPKRESPLAIDEPAKMLRRSPQVRPGDPSEKLKRTTSPSDGTASPLPPPRLDPVHSRHSPFQLVSPQPLTAASIPVLHAWNGHPQYAQHVASAFAQNHFPFVQRFLTPEQQSVAWMATQSFNERLHSRLLASVPYPGPAYSHEGSNFMPFPGALHRQKRIRTAFTPTQQMELEKTFQASRYMVGEERKQLARRLQLTETQIKVWFQNRRTKTRRTDQTGEMDAKTNDQSPSTVAGCHGNLGRRANGGARESGSSESSDESHAGESSDRHPMDVEDEEAEEEDEEEEEEEEEEASRK